LKATLKVGKNGISPQFLAALDDALGQHELIKVKFDDFKDQEKELSLQLAEKSRSHLVTRIGNVVVLYRSKPTPTESSNNNARRYWRRLSPLARLASGSSLGAATIKNWRWR